MEKLMTNTSTITVDQLARARQKGERRADAEASLSLRDEPADDVWETITDLDLYGQVTGEKNPSDYDLDLVRSAYEDGYYDFWRDAF